MNYRNIRLIDRDYCEHMKNKDIKIFNCENCSRFSDCKKIADGEANRRFYIAQNFYGIHSQNY